MKIPALFSPNSIEFGARLGIEDNRMFMCVSSFLRSEVRTPIDPLISSAKTLASSFSRCTSVVLLIRKSGCANTSAGCQIHKGRIGGESCQCVRTSPFFT